MATGSDGTRAARLAFAAVLALVGAALAAYGIQGRVAGLGVDDAFYLLLADRHFGRLDGEPALAAFLDTRTYPPLYPLLLGAFGGGSDAILAAHVVNAAIVLAWVAALLAFLLRAGVPTVAAALLGLAAAFAPFTLYHAQELWSEHPYLALQLAALALVAARPLAPGPVLLAGCCVGLALLTRTMGVALLAAFAAWLAWQRPPRWLPALALAALPLLERFTHGANVYGGELAGWAALDAGGALARLRENVAGLWLGWRLGLSMTEPPALLGPLLLFGLALGGWAIRLRERALDAVLVPAHLAVAVAWGFSAHAPRFLYPLWPVALFHAWLAACWLVRRVPAERRRAAGTIVAAVLASAVAIPALWHAGARLAIPVDARLSDYKRIQRWLTIQPATLAPWYAASIDLAVDDNARVRAVTPAGACVLTDTPGLTLLHAHRVPYGFPWRSLDELARTPALPCRYAYFDPMGVKGADDDARIAAAGMRVLFRSDARAPDGSPLAGLLIELRSPR